MNNKLTLLTLPIGNLSDISQRALEALKVGKNFIAEDSRMLVSLLNHLEIDSKDKSIISFHEHSSEKELQELVSQIKKGREFYLVSDAGSPIVSDPAFPLIKECLEQKIEIDTFPGVSSVVAALELSGLPPQPFHFYGFFPREDEKRKQLLKNLSNNYGTFIFFDSPHRILKSLKVACDHFPQAKFAVCRELTKKFQNCYRFQGFEFENILEESEIKLKGEFCFLFHLEKQTQNGASSAMDSDILELAENVLKKGGRHKELSKLLSKILGKNGKEIYSELTKFKTP